jgi:hypothetical protein
MKKILVLLILSLLLILLPATTLAWQKEDRVWDKEIMKQPFDQQPFRQVNVPAWLHQTIGCGYTLSVMDGPARARAAAHGVSLSEIGFVDPLYVYYDSKLLHKRNPHVPPDRLEKDAASVFSN